MLSSDEFGQAEVDRLRKALGRGQIGEVRQRLAELAARAAGNGAPRDRLAIGVTQYLLGQPDAAERALSALAGNGMAEYYRGRALMSLERYEEAADQFAKAAEHGYDKVQCTLNRAGAVRLLGRLEEAEQLVRSTGREGGAGRAEYSFQMGCILDDRGDTTGAVEYLERAVDMDPHHQQALFKLANKNNLVGNDAEAIRLYEQALSSPPYHLGVLINLGLLYEDTDNQPAAAFCFRRVLDVYPNHARALLYLRDIEASADMYYDEEAERRRRELDQVLRIPVADFELSARARNCLESAGVYTLGDLTRTTEAELLASKNFGDTSLREVNELLGARGLRIGQFAHQPAPTAAPAWRAETLSPQERAQLEAPVADLNLSVRARKCLMRLGIGTLGELVSKSADELLSVRNFGVTSLNEVRAKLDERGMKLRND